MTYTLHKSQVRAIRPGEPNFTIQDGFVQTPRAMLHILPDCPGQYVEIIEICVERGWLKPVAHVTERELLFMGLSK
jgi:hypothetical protein